MCIDGHVIVFDSEQIREIGRLLNRTSANVNQIARAANSGFGANRNDISDVNNNLTELRTMFGDLLSVLTEVADAKPGKLFIPLPKITDYTVAEQSESEDAHMEQTIDAHVEQALPIAQLQNNLATVGEGRSL